MSEQSQNIKPKNRLQHLLAKIAGNDNAKTVKPKMKNEFYLNDIADEGGSGGGGGGGVDPVLITVTHGTNPPEGTWTGATWEELFDAFTHGCARVEVEIDYGISIQVMITTYYPVLPIPGATDQGPGLSASFGGGDAAVVVLPDGNAMIMA